MRYLWRKTEFDSPDLPIGKTQRVLEVGLNMLLQRLWEQNAYFCSYDLTRISKGYLIHWLQKIEVDTQVDRPNDSKNKEAN